MFTTSLKIITNFSTYTTIYLYAFVAIKTEL